MVKFKALVALTLITLLCVLSPLAAFALEAGETIIVAGAKVDPKPDKKAPEPGGNDPVEGEESGESEDDGESTEEGNGKLKEWKEQRDAIREEWKAAKTVLVEERAKIEELKAIVEVELDELEAAYEAAKASGDTALMATLTSDIQAKRQEMMDLKADMTALKVEMKARVKAEYSADEISGLEEAAAKIKKENPNVKVLPAYNVIASGFNIKFDTPPVIKSGRTLLPVRALSEGFGANVAWDDAAKTVTITRGEDVIVLNLGTNEATHNGQEFILDVPAETLNNRMMVPLRFVIEKLKLKVEWDDTTETIEIVPEEPLVTEPAADPDPEDTTGSPPEEPIGD